MHPHRPLFTAGLALAAVSLAWSQLQGSAPTLAQGQERRPSPTITQGVRSAMSGLYQLTAPDLEGKAQDLAQFQGKVALVVNVASECGYTPQYEGLEALYKKYAAQGLVVLGFPSNEFGGQEPGSSAEIRTFCTSRFQVTFPMFAKVEVKPGAAQSPVYQFLTASGHVPSWNFCKFLVGPKGDVLGYFASSVTPDSAELQHAIEQALHSGKSAH